MESMKNEVAFIIKQENKLVENGPLILDENNKNADLEAIFSAHPGFEFKYSYHKGLTYEKYLETYSAKGRNENFFDTVYLQTIDGGVIVTMSNPDLFRWSVLTILSCIVFATTILLLLIGFFVSRKSNYIKKISNYLEIIQGGDLTTHIPVKGYDEMSQLAVHINQMTQALNEQQKKQQENDEMKKQLIANISHDLRTPLTAVLGYLSLLEQKDTALTQENKDQYIHKALERTQHVSHLVDQLFDYVLIANHQTVLKKEAVDPSIILHQLILESDGSVEEESLVLDIELLPATNRCLMDIQLSQRLTDNVIANVEKYSIAGKPVIIRGQSINSYYKVVISNETEQLLEDTQEDFLERYFTTDRISGKSAGLGLAICKEIMQVQGGDFFAYYKNNQFSVVMQFKEVE